jgi:hypothetical protein
LIDADVFDLMLKDAQSECKKSGGNFRYGVLSNVRANLAKMPTVDRWISVKDRLPTDAGIYIICDHYGNVMSRHFCKSHGKFAGYWHFNGSAKYGNPLYWMPLPEPPKEET